jgi:ABC-type uncharacterized transport system substrate-binding protein
LPRGVDAHPHVFVDARSELVFDAEGRLSAIRQIWRFDDAFTAFATEGLDLNADGVFSAEELEPLAKVNVESIAEFGYFTFLTMAGRDQSFVPPTEYWVDLDEGLLTLFYTLTLATPTVVNGTATVQVYDPEFFIAFEFVQDGPFALIDPPDGCEAVYMPPEQLSMEDLMLLGQIPPGQDLPSDLRPTTSFLANAITVTCAETSSFP